MGHVKDKKEWIVLIRLADIILQNVQGSVIDIGMGMSTRILAKYARRFDRDQHSCDQNKWYTDNLILHDKHKTYNEKALDFYKRFNKEDHQIALVFIDCEHSYETNIVLANHFIDNIEPYGVIFIHDTFPPGEEYIKPGSCWTAYKVRQELEKREGLDVFTWPYLTQAQCCGLTMVMPKHPKRPYYHA